MPAVAIGGCAGRGTGLTWTMDATRPPAAAATAGRDPIARQEVDGRLGAALFLAWLLLAASGFWTLIIVPMQAGAAYANDPAQRAAVERWVHGAIPEAFPSPAVIALLDPAACGCPSSSAAALADRLRASGVTVVELPQDAPRLAQRPEVAIIGGDGRLRYAGPARPSLLCTAGRSLAESAAKAEGARGEALVLPAECRCDETAAADERRDPRDA